MFKISKVSAHCDIPCKIYDPAAAQYAVLSVIRFLDLINEIDDSSMNKKNSAEVARLTVQKEEHAQIAKDEIVTIWGDYFKEPQITKFPEVHELVHGIMMSGSKSKQSLNRENAEDLLKKVNRFAEIFWATKDIETENLISPYPPSMPVVCPKLQSA
jgi:nickel superoxide dismutase|tara:strand:- start:4358 stop:4828 length:471 start_codon:yes stop_codon:yes gene_type:complete